MAPSRRKNRKLQIKADAYRVGETVTPERAKKLGGIEDRPIAYANKGQVALKRQQARIECTLDSYRYRRKISDEQHQAGMKFRTSYMNAVRSPGVVDLTAIRVDNSKPVDPEKPPDFWDRKTIRQAQETLTLGQYEVVENVAGWDGLAGNTRKLDVLRAGLDELYRVWF
jgi:hypothetical protein